MAVITVKTEKETEKYYFDRSSLKNHKISVKEIHLFFLINNEKFKQSPRKLNNPLREQAKTLFLHERNAHFWTCQFKSVHYIL